MKNKQVVRMMVIVGIFSAVAYVVTMLFLSSTGLGLAYGTLRLGTEGLFVKSAAMLFGPLFGFASGLVTSSLVELTVPYSAIFILYVALTGLVAGLYKHIVNKHLLIVFVNIIIGIGFVASIYYLATTTETSIKILIFNLDISKAIIIVSVFWIAIGVISWVFYFSDLKTKSGIMRVLFVVTIMDIFIDIPLLSLANHQRLGLDLELEIFVRTLTVPFKLIFNTVLLFMIQKHLFPVIKRYTMLNKK